MTNKYLEKIAADGEKKMNAFERGVAGYASALGGSVGAGMIGSAIQPHLSRKVQNYISSPHAHSDMGTVRKMMRDNKINVTFNTRKHVVDKHVGKKNPMKSHLGTFSAHGPAFVPSSAFEKNPKGKKDFVIGVKQHRSFANGNKSTVNPDVIMHELGHAKDFSKFKRLKVGAGIAGKIGGIAAPALLMSDKTEDYAVPVAAASALPTLRSEAAANYHAYKGIKAHKGAAAASGFARKLLPAQMGNYAMAAAAGVGGVYLGKKILDKVKSNYNKKNNGK